MSGMGGKVAFSLASGTKKKRKTPVAVPVSEFGQEESQDKVNSERPVRTSPLVIPLVDSSDSGPRGRLLATRASRAQADPSLKESSQQRQHGDSEKDRDAVAAEALVQSAAHHFAQKEQQQDGETNFSAKGSIVIASSKNQTISSFREETETQQFLRDLQDRPDEVAVDSEDYQATPISEFGAAMLRGMGWKGDSPNTNSNNQSESMPRPHRLGLGATPKLPSASSIPGRMRRPDQVEKDERLARQHKEYEEQRLKRVRQDKQQTLQAGSIITLGSGGRRARMVKLTGVPGLNRVLVQLEGDIESTSIKRGDIMGLATREELESRPFQDPPQASTEKDTNETKGDRDDRQTCRERRDHDDDGHRAEDRERKRRRDDRHRDERDRHERDRNSGEDDRRKKRREDSDRRRDDDRERKKRRRDEEPEHWLLSNIRIRVVTKKLGRHQYKQKGIVLDVIHGGANATLQMADGQVLDQVSERDLETALPKVGGNAIVLTGKHKYSKGRLLERNSELGRASCKCLKT